MRAVRKAGSVATAFRRGGVRGVASSIVRRFRRPSAAGSKATWEGGVPSEVEFWDKYLEARGGTEWAGDFDRRLDPNLPLQPRPAALLPKQAEIRILDVGAGPLTYLGKLHEGRPLHITAVDPLASDYAKVLARHGIEPLVRTQAGAAEELTSKFPPDSFDFVFARNCIDHSYDPFAAINEMIAVVKQGRYVLLEHRVNEGATEHYAGLHQWDFSVAANGDFVIASRGAQVNVTRKCEAICDIACEVVAGNDDGEWLITRIRKK